MNTNIETTTEVKTSNRLAWKTTLTKKGLDFCIDTKLADDCRNGHNDFSITGTIYPHGKRGDRNMLYGGAIGHRIAEIFPEYTIFNNLHLCDAKGIPMHASANMFYHLREGFEGLRTDSIEFFNKFKQYYRLSEKQCKAVFQCKSEIQLYLCLVEHEILLSWQNEAIEAIMILEQKTGLKFVDNSVRSNLVVPSEEQISKEKEKIQSGYYTHEQIKEGKFKR